MPNLTQALETDGQREVRLFVRDGMNSVADYNSRRMGVVVVFVVVVVVVVVTNFTIE